MRLCEGINYIALGHELNEMVPIMYINAFETILQSEIWCVRICFAS